MALDKPVGTISRPVQQVPEEASNAQEVQAAVNVAKQGFNMFELAAEESLRSDIEDLFGDVPEFESLEEDEFAELTASGGLDETVRVSTADHPFISRLVQDVRRRKAAVDQGTRSQQWYQAQVDKLVAEYTDIAPGLARDFALVGNQALNRGISQAKVQERLTQEAAYEEWREKQMELGDKHNIPRRMWLEDPLGAMAKLEVAQNIEYRAALANNANEIDKNRGEINSRNAERHFNAMLPRITVEANAAIRNAIGVQAGVGPEIMAEKLAQRGGEDATQLELDWQAQRMELYNNMNASGRGLPMEVFNQKMAALDRQVEIAVEVMRGERAAEDLANALAINQTLSENQLYDTDSERKMMAYMEVYSQLPDNILGTEIALRWSQPIGDFLAQQMKGLTPNYGSTKASPESQDGTMPKAITGVLNALKGAAGLDNPDPLEGISDDVVNMFDQLARNPEDIHVANMDAINNAINEDEFWTAVDRLPADKQRRIYNNVNTVMRERALVNDSTAADQYASRPISSSVIVRGEMPEGVSEIRDLITVNSSYPPRASVRSNVPENMRGAAHREAVKFNQGVARRVRQRSEAYAKFMQRNGDSDATPQQAYSELYGPNIYGSFLREDESPELSSEAQSWWNTHGEELSPMLENNNREGIRRYMNQNGAPEDLKALVNGG